ncbi:PREDICTED: uncharacterized protein LOC106338486 [Brassica oleracea var. oleracea]|uniref:uncharacterized protein LOC106338486 n=1 Tax=Brassica oleracea var. oleracea TaxID=109376 RepID=UPI0006A724D9|nr:PREDICTED: uncharacterized protein LOC106338486 [Brassica oleracea var. oleracea]
MNRQVGSRARGASEIVRCRTQENDEEEIIRVPTFDNSDLIAKFKQTLIGRMFHPDGRSVEALLKHMPKRRIWDVEGRVRGTNLGNNRWSFSLERWTPTIKEDFPNSLPFWAVVSGVPIHYKKLETYESVGKALGVYDKADVEGGRVRVFVNGDLPLKFDCKIGFENGDVVKVKIQYEDLYRHCFSCKRISHEEGTWPELNENQRERNRLARIEQKDKEERATREAFSQPQRRSPGAYNDRYDLENRGREKRPMYLESPGAHRGSQREDERQHDLRKQLKEKREGTQYENQSKKHWDQGYTNSRSRMSIDSQRTISENPRRQDYMAPARRWKSQSPPSGTLEWRPLNRARESEKPRGLLKKDNLVGNPKGSSGGEVPEESANNRSNTETQGRLQDNQTMHCMDIDSNERGHEEETARSKERLPQTSDLNQGLRVEQGDEEVQETDKEREAREEKETDEDIEEYAALGMTDEMIDEDDLLDGIVEMEKDMEDGRIEAISQLSPERPTNKTSVSKVKTGMLNIQGVEKGGRPGNTMEKKNKQSSQQNASLGRKRGARSPDLKGASASRKLA